MSDIYRFEVVTTSSASGQQMISSVHYQTDKALGDPEPSATKVLDELVNHFGSTSTNLSIWRACATSLCSFVECRVREEVEYWNGEIGVTASKAIGQTGSLGTAGANATPDGLAFWIGLKADLASKSARGGVHLPGPWPASLLDTDGRWLTGTGGTFAAAQTLGAKIVDPLNDVFGIGGALGDILPVIYSETRRRRGQTPYTFQITQSRVSPEPRWLRRRMREAR